MMPEGAHLNIRSVHIYYSGGYNITGFKFYNKHNSLLWEIGYIKSNFEVETVELENNEVIIGVKAKLCDGYQSIYTDFQFLIGRAWWVDDCLALALSD